MAETEPIEVQPEPPEDVRAAIAEAVRRPRPGEREPGPWWRAGVEDAVRCDCSRD